MLTMEKFPYLTGILNNCLVNLLEKLYRSDSKHTDIRNCSNLFVIVHREHDEVVPNAYLSSFAKEWRIGSFTTL